MFTLPPPFPCTVVKHKGPRIAGVTKISLICWNIFIFFLKFIQYVTYFLQKLVIPNIDSLFCVSRTCFLLFSSLPPPLPRPRAHAHNEPERGLLYTPKTSPGPKHTSAFSFLSSVPNVRHAALGLYTTHKKVLWRRVKESIDLASVLIGSGANSLSRGEATQEKRKRRESANWTIDRRRERERGKNWLITSESLEEV